MPWPCDTDFVTVNAPVQPLCPDRQHVCTYCREHNCKPSCIYACMHQQKLWFLCMLSLIVKDMCHGALRSCHFVQPREQWRSACFQQKTIHRADAEGRAFVCLCPLVLLSSVRCVIARICSKCKGCWWTPDMKQEDLAALSSFEGLNCLKTALLSKI